jgi:hypothetical protein
VWGYLVTGSMEKEGKVMIYIKTGEYIKVDEG